MEAVIAVGVVLTGTALASRAGRRPAIGASRPVSGLLLALVPVTAIAFAGCSDTSRADAIGASEIHRARAFKGYRLYYLGDSFRGLPLTGIDGARGERREIPAVDFLYGDCDPSGDDGGCELPIDIQVWSICERNVKRVSGEKRLLKVRGVPAAEYLEDTEVERIEVYTGNVDVVVFTAGGLSPRRVAHALRSLDGKIGPGERLPSPVDGALTRRPSGCR